MRLYPAIRARMGSWTYYTVRMTMREAAMRIRFAADMSKDPALGKEMRRRLDRARVKKGIVQCLSRRDDRFLTTIVVAALKGDPTWIPLDASEVPSLRLLGGSPLGDALGVLRFDGGERYYAIDGHHRLAAIRALMDRGSRDARGAPEGLGDEEIPVMVVVPAEGETEVDFLERYRFLLQSLSRHAGRADLATKLAVDGGGAFAT